MRIAVLISFFVYTGAFRLLQEVIGKIRHARTARPQRINFLLPAGQLVSMVFLCVSAFTMAHQSFNNLAGLRIAGYVVVAIGLFVSMWAQWALGSNWSGHIGVHKKHQLVTTGPYKWVRNPMYSGMWISGIGICLVSLNVFYSLAALTWALAFSTRIPAEEAVMKAKFKRKYDQYCSQTGRLVPRRRKRC